MDIPTLYVRSIPVSNFSIISMKFLSSRRQIPEEYLKLRKRPLLSTPSKKKISE
jgi:hypothetical protein